MTEARRHIVKPFQLGAIYLCIAAMPFSIKLCHLGAILYLALWLFEGQWEDKIGRLKANWPLLLLICVACLQLAGMLITSDKSAGWRYLETAQMMLFLPLALGASANRFSSEEVCKFLWAFTIVCTIAVSICVAGSMVRFAQLSVMTTEAFWAELSYGNLSNVIGMNPIYLALYLLVSIVFLLTTFSSTAYRSPVSRAVSLAWISFLSVAIIFLASRMMIFLLFVFLFLAGIDAIRQSSSKGKAFIIGIPILLAALAFTVNPVTLQKNWQELTRTNYNIRSNQLYSTSTEIRASLLFLAGQCAREANLLTGIGTGDVEMAMEEKADELGITNIHQYYNPHNQYVAMLIGNGLPGLLLYIAFLGTVAWRAWRSQNLLACALVAIYLFAGMTEPVLERQKSVILLALLLPLLAFQREPILTKPSNIQLHHA